MTTTSNTRAGERWTLPKRPTCQRKPSERIGDVEAVCGDCNGPRPSEPCDDPVHGMADAAPALYEALRGLVEHQVCRCGDEEHGDNVCPWCVAMGSARAALSLAAEGKSE